MCKKLFISWHSHRARMSRTSNSEGNYHLIFVQYKDDQKLENWLISGLSKLMTEINHFHHSGTDYKLQHFSQFKIMDQNCSCGIGESPPPPLIFTRLLCMSDFHFCDLIHFPGGRLIQVNSIKWGFSVASDMLQWNFKLKTSCDKLLLNITQQQLSQ